MRYDAHFVPGGARLKGWYVRDVTRPTPGVLVIVGGRHATQIEAQSEARRLEIDGGP